MKPASSQIPAKASLGSRPRLVSIRSALKSPYMAMPLWVGLGLILYTWQWSYLFSPLRPETMMFLIATSTIYIGLAFQLRIPDASPAYRPTRALPIVIITGYFAAAFVENGGIPIVQILRGQPYDVYGFGIEGLHVAMLAFAGFYGVRCFRVLLTQRSTAAVIRFGWITTLLLSIGNRSAASFLAFACLVVWLRQRSVSPRAVLVLTALGLFAGLLFGQFGDIRLSFQIGQVTMVAGEADAIATVAQATPAFTATGLSSSWLWVYMYLASPIANLNNAFAVSGGSLCGFDCEIARVLTYELIPDAFGSRLGETFGAQPLDTSSFLIASNLTAATAFGASVGAAGFVGGVLVIVGLTVTAIVSVGLLRGSDVAEEGIALLATIIFFSFFENMLAYSALSIQLLFAVVSAKTSWRFL